MILKLINDEEIVIYRQNCGFQEYHNRMWNINPVQIIQANKPGFFIIGGYGTIADDRCDKMIPVRSVLYIKQTEVWEAPDNVQHFKRFIL